MCSTDSSVKNLHNNINTRIYDRNIPTKMLQPYISNRPVMTKYSLFPIIDRRTPANIPLINCPTYNVETNFNPGTNPGPWSGFATNINLESELRNQVYALQKCSQSVYVPNSNSDLYQIPNSFNRNNDNNNNNNNYYTFQPHSHNPNPNPNKIGIQLFSNNTRVQLRN